MYDTNNPLSTANNSSLGGVNLNNSALGTGASALTNSLFQPRHQVQQVASQKDIYAVQMGVNSSDFILDANKPIIYYVETDNAGNKVKAIPFDIQQHIEEPEPTMKDVKDVEARLEAKFDILKDEISDLVAAKLEEALK